MDEREVGRFWDGNAAEWARGVSVHTRRLAERGAKMAGIDISGEMIATALAVSWQRAKREHND